MIRVTSIVRCDSVTTNCGWRVSHAARCRVRCRTAQSAWASRERSRAVGCEGD